MPKHTSDSARAILSRFDTYFSLASVKAALILPANAVLLAVVASGVYQVRTSSTQVALTMPVQIGVTLTLVLSLASAACGLWVTFAHLKSGNRTGAYASLVFFGSIRQMQRETFTGNFVAANEEALTQDILDQVHHLSDVLWKKYVWLNWSVGLCAAGCTTLVMSMLCLCWGI